MASILDKYRLEDADGQEKFEGCIAVGITMPQLLIAFRKTEKEMDEWCLKTYHMNFKTTFEAVKMGAVSEYLDCVHALGIRGNPSALNIINEALRGAQSTGTVKIVFEQNMPNENEKDKEDEKCN